MTTVSQRLSTLQAERGHLVANFEATIQASLDEDRDLNEAEVDATELMRERIEGIDKQIERWTAAEALLSRQAAPLPAVMPGNRAGTTVTLATPRQHPHIQMQRRDDYKGAAFTRMAIATCVAGQWNAAEYARQRWGDDEIADLIRAAHWYTRAQTSPISDGAGTVIQTEAQVLVRLEQMGSEFIEMLRPMLIVARLPSMRRLQFNGAGMLLIPRQTGGVAGGYVGEGGNITVQRLNFGQLQLVPSKLAVIVPMTNEILNRADPGLEQLVRDDMLQGTARTIDSVFFSAAPPAAGPAGILNGRTPVPNASPGIGSGPGSTTDVTGVTVALKNMILALRMQNVPMLAPVWIMNARTKEFLRLLRSSIDVFVFKAEIDAGTLLGYPIIDSTNIPIPFPPDTGQQTAWALIDASQLIWAEDMLPVIDASEHASIISADPPPQIGYPPSVPEFPGISAFQADMVFMRIRMRHTWNRRHDVAVAWALIDDTTAPPPLAGLAHVQTTPAP